MIFIHPFELVSKEFNLPFKVNLRDKFRFCYGRKNNLKKIKNLIKIIRSNNYAFLKMNQSVS